jgi:Type II CAAX prenyl endopeptidase Rce1-like
MKRTRTRAILVWLLFQVILIVTMHVPTTGVDAYLPKILVCVVATLLIWWFSKWYPPPSRASTWGLIFLAIPALLGVIQTALLDFSSISVPDLLLIFTPALMVGTAEEMWFRSGSHAILRFVSIRLYLVLSPTLFGLFHLGNGVVAVIITFLFSLTYDVARTCRVSIIWLILVHALIDVALSYHAQQSQLAVAAILKQDAKQNPPVLYVVGLTGMMMMVIFIVVCWVYCLIDPAYARSRRWLMRWLRRRRDQLQPCREEPVIDAHP